MNATEKLTVLTVGLAIADEHPQALHHLAFYDDTCLVMVQLVPDSLRNALHQLQVLHILVKRSRGIHCLRVLRQLLYRTLVVDDKKSQEVINALQIHTIMWANWPSSPKPQAHAFVVTGLSTAAEGVSKLDGVNLYASIFV